MADFPELSRAIETTLKNVSLFVCNIEPFQDVLARNPDFEDCIGNINVEQLTLIRAAAKSYKDIAIIVEPIDYKSVEEEIAKYGATTLALRRKLAVKAFAYVAAYDIAIANWIAEQSGIGAPHWRAVSASLIETLRYGENPHQSAAFYKTPEKEFGVATARQIQGKQLSYNNIDDTDAAFFSRRAI